VAERMQALLDRGYSDTEASAIVDREERAAHAEAGHDPHVIYVMP
jgi:uncharacterized protein YoaH (UPF0181 family)